MKALFSQILSTFKFIDNSTADWKTYTNVEYGFEIKYPGDWKDYDPARPRLLNSDKYQIVYDVGDIESFNKKVSDLYKQNKFAEAESLRANIECDETNSCPKIISRSPIVLGGINGEEFMLRYSGRRVDDPLGYIDELHQTIIKDGKVYSFWTSHSDDEQDKGAFEILRKILSTFKFTK